MAYQRKPFTARRCQHCGDPYAAVDRRRLYCCPGCKTAASQARRPSTAASAKATKAAATPDPSTSLAAPSSADLPLAVEPTPTAPVPGPGNPSFGKLVLATAAGNLLTEAAKSLWSPKAAAGSTPTSGWPTWPPAELLATTGPPVRVSDPSWGTPQWLTPVRHHGHLLYLYVEEGLTVIVRQDRSGLWHYVRTPAELAQLAAQAPRTSLQALIDEYVPTYQLNQAPASAPDRAAEAPLWNEHLR
jgi:hypothetical protein